MIEKPFITILLLALISVSTGSILVKTFGLIASILTTVVQYSRLRKIVSEDYEGKWNNWFKSNFKFW